MIRFRILGSYDAHRGVRSDVSLKLLLFRPDEVSLGTGSYQGCRRYGGEAEGEARYADRQAEPPAPRQLLFQVNHFGFAFRTGAGTVSLVLAFRRNEFYVIRFGNLPSDLLEYPAYFLSSFHLFQFCIRICQRC